ncbi:hypothetical protein HIM_03388 [Hirsutella minnesotensis 3608]|uniref:AB hydrolase-1 domain-containing protein n=1 Tax=Hirsutella minnesotensis 3608 TaxID=1043627 RepID=A0A0F8A2K3_9HYPO|nr:hypothetical protein HIM_03388 [Hirsutella minnesotensis 3608]
MGMSEIKEAWQYQTLYFGHDRSERYSVLIIDNRGIGGSDKPISRYSTELMAAEVIQVLDHVGWTAQRDVHLIGISLGGMISQKVAQAIPERIKSLTLLSTSAGMFRTMPTLRECRDWMSVLSPGSEETQIANMIHLLFPDDWLAKLDTDGDPSPSTTSRFKLPPEMGGKPAYFESNWQRYQAWEMSKRRRKGLMPLSGELCQAVAVVTHRMSDRELRAMADAVGRERILVVHGTEDRLLSVEHGHHFIDVIQPAQGIIIEGMGHACIMERSMFINKTLEESIEVWNKL